MTIDKHVFLRKSRNTGRSKITTETQKTVSGGSLMRPKPGRAQLNCSGIETLLENDKYRVIINNENTHIHAIFDKMTERNVLTNCRLCSGMTNIKAVEKDFKFYHSHGIYSIWTLADESMWTSLNYPSRIHKANGKVIVTINTDLIDEKWEINLSDTISININTEFKCNGKLKIKNCLDAEFPNQGIHISLIDVFNKFYLGSNEIDEDIYSFERKRIEKRVKYECGILAGHRGNAGNINILTTCGNYSAVGAYSPGKIYDKGRVDENNVFCGIGFYPEDGMMIKKNDTLNIQFALSWKGEKEYVGLISGGFDSVNEVYDTCIKYTFQPMQNGTKAFLWLAAYGFWAPDTALGPGQAFGFHTSKFGIREEELKAFIDLGWSAFSDGYMPYYWTSKPSIVMDKAVSTITAWSWILLTYRYAVWYGDITALARYYRRMKKTYFAYLNDHSEKYVVRTPPKGTWYERAGSTREMVPALTEQIYMIEAARILQSSAKLLSENDDIGIFMDYIKNMIDMINKILWDEERGYYLAWRDSSGEYETFGFDVHGNLMAIAFDIFDITTESRAERILRFIDTHPEIESPIPCMNTYPYYKNTDAAPDYYAHRSRWQFIGGYDIVARLKMGGLDKARRIWHDLENSYYMYSTIYCPYSERGHFIPEGWSTVHYNLSAGGFPYTFFYGFLGIKEEGNELHMAPCFPFEVDISFSLSYFGAKINLSISGKGNRYKALVNGKETAPLSLKCNLGLKYNVKIKLENQK